MTISTSLVVVATPGTYADYARNLFLSAEEHFKPTEKVEFVLIDADTRPWPYPTMMRHHILLQNLPETTFVYLCDADMLFEGFVGAEILPATHSGVVGTQHPGYVAMNPALHPYEKRPESACFVPDGSGVTYFAGGFFGGTREGMFRLLLETTILIHTDLDRGITPVWHDESALNAVFANECPSKVLSPAYAHPQNDDHYVKNVWKRNLPRKLVALDKSEEERGERAA